MIKISRKKAFTDSQFKEVFLKLLFRADGSRRSYRNVAESAILLRLTKWSKTSKSHLGSLQRQLSSMGYTEMKIYEDCRERGLIALNIPFEQFSNNKKLHYNPENNEGINKPIPKNNFLKELAYRLGVEIDVSLMSEEEIYDFIKAMGHTNDTIKEVEEEIKKIKYKG